MSALLPGTLGTAREVLANVPDDTPTDILDLEHPEYIFIVSTDGRCQRIVTKVTRTLLITVTLPISG